MKVQKLSIKSRWNEGLLKLWPVRVREAKEVGMTLIEIIIVVALLGSLMTFLIRNITDQAESAKEDQTKIGMGTIAQALQMYRVHNNKYPTTDQGLQALLTDPGDAKRWRGPYTEANKLEDPWGVKIDYSSDGKTYQLISGGKNQQIGDADDIYYPEKEAAAEGGAAPEADKPAEEVSE